MGCFAPAHLEGGHEATRRCLPSRFSVARGFLGFDWPHRDKLEGEAVEERFELERYSRFGLIISESATASAGSVRVVQVVR